jgi:hypothetical protein
LTQNQYGPAWFGSTQSGNPDDRYDIDQNSDQSAARNANQDNQEYANCDTDGACGSTQHINQNGDAEQNSCTAPSCHIGLIVNAGSGSSTCTGLPYDWQEEGGTCPTPPPPPPAAPSPFSRY